MQSSPSVMKVSDVMSTDLVTAGISESLNEAVYKMIERDVGCTVVTDGEAVIGIITKGDVLRKAFLKGVEAKDVTDVSVKSVMTQPVVTIGPDGTLEEASRLMSLKHVSKLPVVNNRSSKLLGIVTSTDIIRAEPMQVGYLQELVRARFVPHDLL